MSLKLTFQADVDSKLLHGDKFTPIEISLSNPVYRVEQTTVADNYGTKTLWTTGDGGITTFSFGLIISTQDLWVAFRNDDSGTPEYVKIFIKANVPTFIPAKAGGNTTESLDGAVLVDNTDYADVDRIEVQRDAADGVGDAVVDFYLFV